MEATAYGLPDPSVNLRSPNACMNHSDILPFMNTTFVIRALCLRKLLMLLAYIRSTSHSAITSDSQHYAHHKYQSKAVQCT